MNAEIAYFSMEIGLNDEMQTYSGGLGVLAGDTLRAAADRGASIVAVSLIHRKGYFRQRIDDGGQQSEDSDIWAIEDHLIEMKPRVRLQIGGKTVVVRSWLKELEGVLGDVVPVYFLDCDLEENDPDRRALTDSLYGGDKRYRLSQELVLGVGGVRMLEALGYTELRTYHMNEGHAGLLTLELMGRIAKRDGRTSPTMTISLAFEVTACSPPTRRSRLGTIAFRPISLRAYSAPKCGSACPWSIR